MHYSKMMFSPHSFPYSKIYTRNSSTLRIIPATDKFSAISALPLHLFLRKADRCWAEVWLPSIATHNGAIHQALFFDMANQKKKKEKEKPEILAFTFNTRCGRPSFSIFWFIPLERALYIDLFWFVRVIRKDILRGSSERGFSMINYTIRELLHCP